MTQQLSGWGSPANFLEPHVSDCHADMRGSTWSGILRPTQRDCCVGRWRVQVELL